MAPSEGKEARLWPGLAWVLIAAFGVVYALLALLALHGFPFSGDEYSSFLQAELFARGVLHAPAPAHAELLRVDHVIIDQWVCSQYPPGTSALLALGVRAGVPWLVTPVEGMVTLGLVWLTAKRELGARAALVSLVVLGAAPLFMFQAASFFSHTATTMWLAAALACTSKWVRSKGDAWLVFAGTSLGLAFLTRPMDAVLVGMALVTLRSWRVVGLVGLGGAPFAALYFGYQAAQFGGPFRDGYHAYQSTFRAIYGESTAASNISLHHLLSPEQQFYHLDICRSLIADGAFAGSVLLAVLGARAIGPTHPARAMRDVYIVVVILMLVAILPMIADPDDGARPRYLSTALLTIAFLAGPGWITAREILSAHVGTAMTRGLLVAAMVMAPVQIGAFLVQRLPLQWVREGLYDVVAKARVEDGVVIVRAHYPTRYARNGPFFDRPVLYLSAPQEMTADQVAQLFPARRIYEAFEGASWSLVRRR